MPVDILCIGHAAYDLSLFVAEFPAEDSKCEIQQMLESGGGPAANAAYLLSSWGARCGFAGLVGDDAYGNRTAADFQAAGTDISLLELRRDHVTPFSVILVNTRCGSRTIINRKANAGFLSLTPDAFENMSPSVLLFDGHEPEASLAALRSFPKATSILDAGSERDGTIALASRVDYLVASERFALQVAGVSDLANEDNRRTALSRLRQRFATAVVITLGESGVIAENESGDFRLPAIPVRAVDTTAAGDIFHGAFAYGCLQEMSFQENLQFATAAASLSVGALGGRQSIPALADVNEAMARSTI